MTGAVTDELAPAGQVSRRRLLGAAGAGALAGAAAIGAVEVARAQGDDRDVLPAGLGYDFHGEHQAGIVTPAQDRLHFASFDVTTDSRDELVALLKAWTEAAAAMTAGKPVGSGSVTGYDSPPTDTGEALGLPPAGLTLTFGFGPTLFEKDGKDRFGVQGRLPRALRRLPHFPADNLDPGRSDGDLCVQACANDPQVAVHAIRNLARIGFGTVAMRWAQLGFGRTSSTSRAQETPRNLMGFKDGTNNLKLEDSAALAKHVWVAEPGWLRGGSYLVARRIRMLIEVWDRASLGDQEQTIGRHKATGAPLGERDEFAAVRPQRLPATSHVRLAHEGPPILRRGYNFTDGSTDLGRLDAGLFFIAFVRDPDTHYVPMQLQLSSKDGLMEYLQHTGSGLWAVPPGVRPGEYVGQALFS